MSLGGSSLSPSYKLQTSPLSVDPVKRPKNLQETTTPTTYSSRLRVATPSAEIALAINQVAQIYESNSAVGAAGLTRMDFRRLFKALIQHESGFNPKAVSPKGAMGLGQIMPGTARALGLKNPYDVTENLRASARYFVRQLKSFGSPSLALAAYNAGPGAVAAANGVPNFPETKAYVAAITSVLSQ